MRVLLTHCSAEFIKQVLPRLFKPVAPRSVGTERIRQLLVTSEKTAHIEGITRVLQCVEVIISFLVDIF